MLKIRFARALAWALCLIPAASAAADPYSDFRVPDHRTFYWVLQSSGSTGSSKYDSPSGTTRDRTAFGQLLSRTAWSLEAEAQRRDFLVETSAMWSYRRAELASTPAYGDVRRQRDDRQFLLLAGSQRTYLGGSDFALEVRGDAMLELSQSGSFQTRRTVSGLTDDLVDDESRHQLYRHVGSVSIGMGHGRVRDVSGVFSAQLIEQRLLATGRLTRGLSPEALQRIAQLHYLSPDLAAAHDRPERYFWREVERVLREDGALREGSLDAYSLVRVLERSSAGRFARRVGGFIGPVFFGSEERGHEDFESRTMRRVLVGGTPVFDNRDETSSRTRLDREESGVGLSAEYHRPVGMRWQSDFAAQTTYGGGPLRTCNLRSSLQLQYLIADRWSASSAIEHTARSSRLGGVRSEPSWMLVGQTTLSYLVEDSWSIDVVHSHRQSKVRDAVSPFPPFARFHSQSSLSVGLTYRPFGRFDAPGLGVSERLSTPAL